MNEGVEGIKTSRLHNKNVVVIGASCGLGHTIVVPAYAESVRGLAVARKAEPLQTRSLDEMTRTFIGQFWPSGSLVRPMRGQPRLL